MSSSELTPAGDILKRKLRYMLSDVGVADFNEAHGRIVDHIVDLHEVIEAVEEDLPTEPQWIRIQENHKALEEYVRIHFRAEEKAMEEKKFFGLSVQLEQHRKFEMEVARVGQGIAARDFSVTEGLKDFLLDWLFTHINRVDMKYKDFF